MYPIGRLTADPTDAPSWALPPRDDPARPATRSADKALIDTALKRFKLAAEAEAKQRKREQEDLEFDAGDQWPKDVMAARRGSTIGNVVTPARPCLVIPKIDAAVQQTVNQMRSSRFAIEVHPVSGGANAKTAEVAQGLIRHCEVASHAQNARIAGGERAAKCGRGFWRVLKQYSHDGDFDLDLVTAGIDNQFSVYFDPFAVDPMKRDAEWAFITSWMSAARFRREFPQASLSRAESSELLSLGDRAPGWIRSGDDEDGGAFLVAEYFDVETTRETLVETASGWRGLVDDAPVGEPIVMDRQVDSRQVHWRKINAVEVLERELWEGKTIPIIPIIGKAYDINGEKIYKGLISNAKDAQRSYNYMRSAQVEAVGLAPRAPWIMAEGQDEGYEAEWQGANTLNLPALKYRPVSLDGTPIAPPQRNVVEPAVQAITLAAHEADADIKATTGVFEPSLGQNRGDQSGVAIQRLQQQSEHGNSNYLDNYAQSIEYEGEIYLDLLPHVYDRPGRIARILGTDDEPKTVMLNQPFVAGPDGQPQAAPPGMPPPTPSPGPYGAMPPGAMPGAPPMPPPLPPVEHYDLKAGRYAVTVSVGKSFSTRRQEAAASIGDLMTAAPQLAPIIADLWVESLDIPEGHAMAERIKKTLPPELQDPKDGQPAIPAAAQQQIAQASQQLEAMKAEMLKLQQDAASEAQKNEAKRQIAAMQEDTKQQIAAAKIEAEKHIAEVKAQSVAWQTQAKIEAEKHKAELHAILAQITQQTALRHQTDQAASDRAHAALQLDQTHAHEVGVTAMGHAHQAALQPATPPQGAL